MALELVAEPLAAEELKSYIMGLEHLVMVLREPCHLTEQERLMVERIAKKNHWD